VILVRYLTREIYYSLFLFLGIFLFVMVSNSLIQLLEDASVGETSVSFLFKLIGLQLPQMIAFLLPISLFLSVLVVLGKFFSQSELLIMMSSGMGFWQLWTIVQRPTFVVIFVSSLIMFWVQPGMRYYENSINNSLSSSSMSLLQSGRFISLNGGKQVLYVNGQSKDSAKVSEVFVYLQAENSHPPRIIVAPFGHQWINPENHKNYMVLENGYEYQGFPNTLNFNMVHFEDYGLQVNSSVITPDNNPGVDALSSWDLLRHPSLEAWAELEWRVSIPLAAWVLSLLAVGLSYVEPRQGRFGKILPALLVFIIYFNLLVTSRAWLELGVLPPWIGVFWVHGLFALIGGLLIGWRDGVFTFLRR